MSAIGKYIESWLRTKDLRKKDIADAMGYVNTEKCLRRLDSVMAGELTDKVFMEKLRKALGASEEEIKAVVDATHKENREEERRLAALREAAARAAFTPHFYLEHERLIPSQITFVALMGIERLKHLALPPRIASWTEPEQFLHVKSVILDHQLHYEQPIHSGKVAGFTPFGKVTGYDYRRTYDEFVRFDLQGRMLDVCSGNPENGRVTLRIGSKEVTKLPGLALANHE